jgi:hypothetical protein
MKIEGPSRTFFGWGEGLEADNPRAALMTRGEEPSLRRMRQTDNVSMKIAPRACSRRNMQNEGRLR